MLCHKELANKERRRASSRNICHAVWTEEAVPVPDAKVTHAVRMVQIEEEMARFHGLHRIQVPNKEPAVA